MPTLRKSFFPYCLDRQPDGTYAVLNRDYKPLGLATKEHVQYADYPCLVKLPGLTPAMAAQLSAKASPDTQRVYLYDDGCVPTDSQPKWDAYQRRLQLLAALQIGA